MNRLRILVLAPFCDPETASMPYVAYSHAAALAQLHGVTLVVQSAVENAVRRGKAPFHAVEVIRMPRLERIFNWCFRKILKSNYDTQMLTALSYPFAVAFEWYTWRHLRHQIKAGEFDVALRLLPITAVLPSPLAFFLRRGPIPFVIGPINGGLPWPAGFGQLERQKEWISNLRGVYRYLPFARSTYRHASAIMAASSQTYAEFAAYHDKLFFVPENGVSRLVCSPTTPNSKRHGRLRLIFVGGLVSRKGCDMGMRAASPLLRSGLAHLTVVGDGPERSRLEELARDLGIDESVSFCGWLSHAEALTHLQSSDVMVFPSVRDFGGGVVFEALAVGAVPVVVDFGGPGDIVHPGVGYKVPLTNESGVIAEMQEVLSELAQDRTLLERLRQQGTSYAQERLTWDAKAQQTTKVLNWVLRRGPKPDLLPPKALVAPSA